MAYREPTLSRPRPSPAQRRAARRRRGLMRLAVAAAALIVLLIVIVLIASSGGSSSSSSRASARTGTGTAAGHHRGGPHRTAPGATAQSVRVTYRPLWSLPAPLRDPATATLDGGRFVMAGGLDAADVSTSEVDLAGPRGLLHTASLPIAQHDAQAATLGGKVYVFGGGGVSELDHILAYDPASGTVSAVGRLAAPQSDVAVAQWGSTAYVIGGYDGTNFLNTIVAYRAGAAPTVVGHLPVGLRYAAAVAADGSVYVIGGTTPAGATAAVYRFNLTSHAVSHLATLPHPTTHGGAALLQGQIYLVGGRGDADSAQYNGVWAIDPATGRIRAGGHLPQPTSDAAVTALSGGIVVAGGLTPSGRVLASVGELVPVRPAG